ncbi:MAG: hypothetical protein ACOYJC_07525 [Christensenellales bacterium]
MQHVIVWIKSNFYRGIVERALDEKDRFHLTFVDRDEHAVKQAAALESPILIMDVNEYTPSAPFERMFLCDAVKKVNSRSKFVVLFNENANNEVTEQVIRAKREGLIDQFICTSTSTSHLKGIMDAI